MRILTYAIFLIDFVVKAVANGDHNILMIASIEEHRARIENQRCQEQKNHFDRISAAINEVTVENVGIVRRRQSILRERFKSISLTPPIGPTELNMCKRSASCP